MFAGKPRRSVVDANLEGTATAFRRQFSALNDACATAQIKAPSTTALAAVAVEPRRWLA